MNRTTSLGISVERNGFVRAVRLEVQDSPGGDLVLDERWCGGAEDAAVADDVDAAPVADALPDRRDQLVQHGQVGEIGGELDQLARTPPDLRLGRQWCFLESLDAPGLRKG